jgi:hypothetical protein
MTAVTCAQCGAGILPGQEILLAGKGRKSPDVTICSACESALNRIFQQETEDPNYLGAVALGMLAALLASVVWYGFVVLSERQWSLIAIFVGWLVSKAIMIGSGRRRGATLQVISVAITLGAMAFSEYLIVRHFAVQFLAEEGVTGIPMLLPPDLVVSLVYDGLASDPITLVFWLVALWAAFSVPARRQLKRSLSKAKSAAG